MGLGSGKVLKRSAERFILQHPQVDLEATTKNHRGLRLSLRQHLLDIGMPDLNGIDATRQIVAEDVPTKVIALSMHSDKRFVTEMFKAGAAGYLLKESAFEELHKAIEAVLAGQIYVSSRIAGVVIDDYVRQASSVEVSVLTGREREVLQLIAEGRTTKQIAARLHVSAKTIETHRRNTMEKLGIDSVAELTKFAIREGLTSLED